MVKKDKVNELSDFIEILKQITQDNKKGTNELFFRGHEDREYKLEPAIYRDQGYTDNECELYKDVLVEHPDEFRNDTTTLEKLVRMQHYGLPTRLLDITANPLVALFFACTCEKEISKSCDGEVVVLSIPEKYRKYYDSDSVSILSNLCKLKKNDIDKIREKFPTSSKLSKKDFNKQKAVKKLLHEIKKEKSHFESIIEPNIFKEIYCVKAIKNNSRIIIQKGLFLIFGLQETLEEWILPDKIIINKDNKRKILKELESVNITKKSLFPEMESTIKELKITYS